MKNFVVTILLLACAHVAALAQQTPLFTNQVAIIPAPKKVALTNGEFVLENSVDIVIGKKASAADRFAAGQLIRYLKDEWGIQGIINNSPVGRSIRLVREKCAPCSGEEGYTLSVSDAQIVLRSVGEAGLFYGVQTIIQLIKKEHGRTFIKGMELTDWPDTKIRAIHYDTKHHQDNSQFVESFIRELARQKINMLIWEWEDKFEYPSHPEIGAPGAFTTKEMQAFTAYAKQYHIQIVPLVQGLGHASFILKWPQFAALREIPASNFEFCPLKEGTYQLLEDLWRDAMAATPGSEYFHIGSDETYELGACPDCQKKEDEIGKSGLYHLFLTRSGKFIQQNGRKVMAWEAPMGWSKGRLKVYRPEMKQERPVHPLKGLVLTESYDYETPDLTFAKQARAEGFPVFAYDPNPGIEQLFLPYFFSKDKDERISGSLENSYRFLQASLGKNVFEGVIRTSWDDSGLPMQAWMLQFATTAAYSWNTSSPSLEEFTATFFRNRYGESAWQVDSLYRLLNEGAYFYMESFERRVWAWGDIGKTHLPDLPRGDAVEYDPYWRRQYADRLDASADFLTKMNVALAICDSNLARNVRNRYDIEVFKTLAMLIRHTALTYQDLASVEQNIKLAHEQRFVNLDSSFLYLREAETTVKNQLARRKAVFDTLVDIWSKTRLPKGMSTASKKYFFEQDRTRHFANRTPDMSYLIFDETKLNLEGYLQSLQAYMNFFSKRFLSTKGADDPKQQ